MDGILEIDAGNFMKGQGNASKDDSQAAKEKESLCHKHVRRAFGGSCLLVF